MATLFPPAAALCAAVLLPLPVTAQSTVRASVGSAGQEGTGVSSGAGLSQDGRWVSFHSKAPNLVAGDGNGALDIFLRDDHTGTTERLSVSTAGAEASGDSFEPSISGSGARIAFESVAADLVAGYGPTKQIYLRDRGAGTTTVVSIGPGSAAGNQASAGAEISLDGAWVVFESGANNLVAVDTNLVGDVFLHEVATGTTALVSVDSLGVQADLTSAKASVSADGRVVAFISNATNLVMGDTNATTDVFLRDTQTGTTTRVSVDSLGVQADGPSFNCAVSPDGGFVALASEATNLVAGDVNGARDIFLRDVGAGTTTLVSISSAGLAGNDHSFFPRVSWWGECVAFHTLASNFAVNDTNNARDVYLRELASGLTTRVSRSTFGLSPNATSWRPSLAADGRVVAFASDGTNLVASDTNWATDVFLYSPSAPHWIAVEGATAASGTAGDSLGAALSMSGNTVVAGADAQASGGAGSATVFVAFSAGSVLEQATLTASDGAPDDAFGAAAGVFANTAVLGAPLADHGAGADAGAAYVYTRSGTVWAEEAKLIASDAAAGDSFGGAASVSGDTALVGADGADSAYAFTRSGTAWSEQALLVGSNIVAGDAFGAAVSIGLDTAVVGAPDADPGGLVDAGAVYVFVRTGTLWAEETILTAPDVAAGARFGAAVDFTGETAVVGAPADDPGGLVDAGSAYVFARIDGVWALEGKLVAAGAAAGDAVGTSVDGFAELAVVGAAADASAGLDAGAAYLFARDGELWSEQAVLRASDGAAGDRFGSAVALFGGRAAVGAPLDDSLAGVDAGSVRFFDFPSPTGTIYCTAGTSASGCQAAIFANGSPSASAASGFHVTAAGVEGNKPAMFFYGSNGRQANPWGNGTSLQCVVPPVKRGGQVAPSGSNGACDGSYSQDLNAKWTAQPAHNPGAGAVMQAQLWYRDPVNTSNQTTGLSDAVQFVVGM